MKIKEFKKLDTESKLDEIFKELSTLRLQNNSKKQSENPADIPGIGRISHHDMLRKWAKDYLTYEAKAMSRKEACEFVSQNYDSLCTRERISRSNIWYMNTPENIDKLIKLIREECDNLLQNVK